MAIQRPLRDDCHDECDWSNENRWAGHDDGDDESVDLAVSEPLVRKPHSHNDRFESPSYATSYISSRKLDTNDSTWNSGQYTASGTQPSKWSSRARTAAQLGVLVCIGAYTFGQVVYLSPLTQETLATAMSPWFGVAVSRTPAGILNFDGGHVEMLRPMFFVVGAVIPLLASLVLYELAHDRSSQRAASRFTMRTSALLRRKPCVLGLLSPFSVGELLFQLVLIGGNVVLFYYGWVYTRQFLPLAGVPYTFDTTLEISGIVLGYSCVFNMAFLLLPSTRNCAWMDFAGISYTNGVKYHRWLGVATLVTGVAHAVPFYWWWGRLGTLWQNSVPCFDCKLDYLSSGYATWFNVFGELSLLVLLLVGATSIPYVRRRMFETFYYTHHLYILGVIFAVMHWVTIIWWLLPSLVLYLISRSVSTWNALHAVRVLELSSLPDGIVKIVVARSPGADGAFAIGQFVYLCVPAVSKLQWHAFTIASAPTTSATSFTILLKSLGDWTRDLVTLANATTSAQSTSTSANGSEHESAAMPTMLIDGYYGASLQCYEHFSTLCLIGGGIGATPLFAILEDIATRLTATTTTATVTTVSSQRVHFVFSFRELCLLEEIHPVLAKLRELDPRGERLSLHFFLTRRPSDAALRQRIDFARLSRGGRDDATSSSALLAKTAVASASQPFSEPLGSRTSRIAVYVVMLSVSTLAVLWLEFGGGRLLQSGTQWWPLEQFVEITTLFVLPVLVFLALVIETRWKRQTRARGGTEAQQSLLGANDSYGGTRNLQGYSSIDSSTTSEDSSLQLSSHASSATDVITLGDLLSEYDVTVGARPDMRAILTRVHREFVTSQGNATATASAVERDDAPFVEHERVGIFISGPEALKSATERVVAELGSSCFDIHEEEFEL